MAQSDGGPAFPVTDKRQTAGSRYAQEFVYHPGMSLRDYFAGQALVGLLACSEIIIGDENKYAESAYKYADAMVAEAAK